VTFHETHRYSPQVHNQIDRERLRGKSRISELAAPEFAKQMLHMPGVVYSAPPFPVDTFKMANTNDDFHFEYLYLFYLWVGLVPGTKPKAGTVISPASAAGMRPEVSGVCMTP
jgi:hypothetical protein